MAGSDEWVVWYEPPPIPHRGFDWHYVHADYDGAEDSADSRCGSCASRAACWEEIGELSGGG